MVRSVAHPVMEIDTTPSSPTLMTSAKVPTGEEGERLKEDERIEVAGGVTRLNYSSEDINEEREMEAPSGYWFRPLGETEEQGMEGIPPLLAAHLRETERRRRTLSSREALNACRSPVHEVHHSNQQHHIRRGYTDEETASEGKPITFMDSNAREKPLRGRPWEGSRRKVKKDGIDIFAWEYSDMTGIPRTLKIGNEVFVTEQKLNENKKITPFVEIIITP
nr:hypothetical protein [Tanacetum cinerariifolium]